ncbi:MAG: helix-turn-helix domain-containing protein [Actinomycetota bacterium]|jgi:transposase|nr:helix-turn-helix domain-containing protein [Actinomycetota bacterium]
MPLICVLFVLVVGTLRTGARRDFAAMERRRKRAGQLFRQGKYQAYVMRELEVSRQSVSRWHADWVAGGTAALKGAGRAGRLPQLDTADFKAVERQLKLGSLANGYPTDMWTIQRVAEVPAPEQTMIVKPATCVHCSGERT